MYMCSMHGSSLISLEVRSENYIFGPDFQMLLPHRGPNGCDDVKRFENEGFEHDGCNVQRFQFQPHISPFLTDKLYDYPLPIKHALLIFACTIAATRYWRRPFLQPAPNA